MTSYLTPVLKILLPIGIGVVLKQIGVFDAEDGRRIRRFCINFTVPQLVFISMYRAEVSVFSQIAPMVIALTSMTLCFFGLGYIGSLFFREKRIKAGIHAATTFGNYGWIGWAVANVVLGQAGFERAVFFTMFWWPVFYSFGLLIGIVHNEPENRQGVGQTMVTRLLPVAIAITSGIILNLTEIVVPGIIEDTVATFGDMTVPLILLSVGMHLDFRTLMHRFPRATVVAALRMLSGPFIGIGVALLIRLVFPIDEISTRVILLNGAMPVATITPVLEDNYPMDTETVGAAIVLTTIISLISIPLWIPIAEKLAL